MTEQPYDVAIIGAGVVGAAIARELSSYQLSTVLIEAAPDVGAGTSKANTALLHTGFDAKPGSLEAGLVRRGCELLKAYAVEAGIPLEQTGAFLVAWNVEQLGRLDDIEANARTKKAGASICRSCTSASRIWPQVLQEPWRSLVRASSVLSRRRSRLPPRLFATVSRCASTAQWWLTKTTRKETTCCRSTAVARCGPAMS